jgi:hypothetical protein
LSAISRKAKRATVPRPLFLFTKKHRWELLIASDTVLIHYFVPEASTVAPLASSFPAVTL